MDSNCVEVNEVVAKEVADYLDSAERYVKYALAILEGDSSHVDECTKLWRILQSLVGFRARYEFFYRLGIWSALKGCSIKADL